MTIEIINNAIELSVKIHNTAFLTNCGFKTRQAPISKLLARLKHRIVVRNLFLH